MPAVRSIRLLELDLNVTAEQALAECQRRGLIVVTPSGCEADQSPPDGRTDTST
jgi:hypothetical protein